MIRMETGFVMVENLFRGYPPGEHPWALQPLLYPWYSKCVVPTLLKTLFIRIGLVREGAASLRRWARRKARLNHGCGSSPWRSCRIQGSITPTAMMDWPRITRDAIISSPAPFNYSCILTDLRGGVSPK